MYVYDNAFVNLKMGYASALAWVQLMIVLALPYRHCRVDKARSGFTIEPVS